MGICNPLICFLIRAWFIINSSKETCTAGTFQERLIKKRRISKTKAKSKIKNEITEKSERRSIKCLNKQSHCYFLCLRSLVSSSKRYHLGLQLRSATIDDVIIAVASTKLTNFLFIVNTLLEFTFDLFIKHAEPLSTLTLLRARLFYCDCIITTGS